MLPTRRFASIFIALALTAGCAGPSSPTDGGARVDAGSIEPTDGGSTPDAPTVDHDASTEGRCTATGECDPFTASSCEGTALCRPGVMEGPTVCVEPTGELRALGERCGAEDWCVEGASCIDFGDGARCERLCAAGSVGECGEDAVCVGTVTGFQPCIRVCVALAARCDVLAQDCADPELTCAFAGNPETGERYTGCRTTGEQADGEPCGGTDGACARGLLCITEEGVSRCHAPCDAAAAPSTCPAEQTCSGRLTGYDFSYCRGA